jgi:DNA-binding transcriptional MerR regulator
MLFLGILLTLKEWVFYDENQKLVRSSVSTSNGLLKIGEVANKTGVSLRTIRYYEELSLINPIGRSSGGFRLYDDKTLSQIRLIQYLQELELSLKEIKNLLASKEKGRTRGQLAKDLLSRLRNHCAEAERKRAVYQDIIRDFDEGMKILSECRDCLKAPDEPHCGKHEIFNHNELLPAIIRSLF